MTDALEVGGAPGTARQAETNVREVTRVLMALRHIEAGDLAKVVGISRASMYERLNGRRPFGLGEVAILAEYFGINPAAFLAGPNALISDTAKAAGLGAPGQVTGPVGARGNDEINPGSIKNRRRLPGVSRDVTGGRLIHLIRAA